MSAHTGNNGEGRLILANPLNELTYRDVAPQLTSVLDLSAFQELWLIEPGDVFVTPRPLPHSFLEMVCGFLDVKAVSFTCLSPDARPDESLLSALRRTGMLSQLRVLTVSKPDMRIRACALDQPLLEISRDLGLPIEGYNHTPSASLLETVYHLNTKSGFRDVATALGLPLAPGQPHVKPPSVEEAVHRILEDHDEAIVKCDRGSGGSGQFRISRQSMTNETAAVRRLRSFVESKAKTEKFVVEACLPLQLDPTIDVDILEGGPRPLYVGAMECTNGTFQGMRVPAPGLSGRPLADLHLAADRIGTYLFANGYRGFFDIDAGLAASGDLYLFEANVRRTSTSLWDGVLGRVFGSERRHRAVWRLGTRTLPPSYDPNSLLSFGKVQSRCATHGGEPAVTLMTWASSAVRSSILYLNAGMNWDDVMYVEELLKEAVMA